MEKIQNLDYQRLLGWTTNHKSNTWNTSNNIHFQFFALWPLRICLSEASIIYQRFQSITLINLLIAWLILSWWQQSFLRKEKQAIPIYTFCSYLVLWSLPMVCFLSLSKGHFPLVNLIYSIWLPIVRVAWLPCSGFPSSVQKVFSFAFWIKSPN